MRIVAAAVLVLAVASAASAQGQERGQYDCVEIPKRGEQSVVVAFEDRFNVGRRYTLQRADRICTRRRKGRSDRLRSFDVVGTEEPTGPARVRVLLGRQGNFIDVDTSTATSVMLPESDGTPAYACYRFLSDEPAARLCVPADVDGTVNPDGKVLFCNRGRCRPRNVKGLLGARDLYEGAADANVTLPDGSTPHRAMAISVRTAVGSLSMNLILGVRDAVALGVELEADGVWRFEGERQTGAEPPVATAGKGTGKNFENLQVEATLNSAEGSTTFDFNRKDADDSVRFGRCYLLTLRDGTANETTVRLPVVTSANGLGASRPTTELASDGTAVADLAAGVCAVTTTGRLSCAIPSGDTDVRLLGIVQLVLDPETGAVVDWGGQGDFAVGPAGRSGTWTAVDCPAQ